MDKLASFKLIRAQTLYLECDSSETMSTQDLEVKIYQVIARVA